MKAVSVNAWHLTIHDKYCSVSAQIAALAEITTEFEVSDTV